MDKTKMFSEMVQIFGYIKECRDWICALTKWKEEMTQICGLTSSKDNNLHHKIKCITINKSIIDIMSSLVVRYFFF